eukprot:m.240660 g.240660  ORF g.240660 m.240660 type:complete len:402 (-) comp23526_c0_seq1:22-1227(-)
MIIRAKEAVLDGVLRGPVAIRVDEAGNIAEVSSIGSEEGFDAAIVIPGFVDIHTHGFGGTDDVLTSWANPGHSQRIQAAQGTTSFLASLIFPHSASSEGASVRAMVETLRSRVGCTGHGAVLEGFHAEGPIINDAGALAAGDAAMSVTDFAAFLDWLGPALRVMTISPHVDAKTGFARIKTLASRGVLVSMGHDKQATHDEILGAMRAAHEGAGGVGEVMRTHITHLFNVSTFHHREPSLVNFGLCDKLPITPEYAGLPSPTVEVIGDCCHVHALTLRALLSARAPDDVVFITDALCEAVPQQRARYCGRPIAVSDSGKYVVLEGTDTLAGSCCSLLEAFRMLVQTLGLDVADASRMLSSTPARRVGLTHVGRIAVGQRADLLLLDEKLTLLQTLIAGKPQ